MYGDFFLQNRQLRLAVLVAMSAAIGNARWITVKKGWKHPAMMWGILIGKAGTVKTWALNPAVVPLQKRQDLYHAKYRHELRKWNSEKAEYSRLAPSQKRYAPLPNNNPPLLLRILSKEGTPEKMIQNCADSPHGFLIHSDEMKTFVGSFDAYKANAKTSSAESIYCTLFNGGGLDQERVGGDRHAPHAFASILGSIQPAIARRCFNLESFQSGFISRFLAVMPPAKIARASRFEVSDETERNYFALINELLDLQVPQPLCEWTPDNPSLSDMIDTEPEITLMTRLTPEAQEVWWNAYNDTAEEMTDCNSGKMLSAFEKIRVYAARFALVLHVARQVEQRLRLASNGVHSAPWANTEELIGDDIDAESMQRAIELANWFKYETKRCYATNWGLADDESNPEIDELHQRIVNYLDEKGGKIAYWKLVNGLHRHGKEAIEAALEQLSEQKVVKIEEGAGNRSGKVVTLTKQLSTKL